MPQAEVSIAPGGHWALDEVRELYRAVGWHAYANKPTVLAAALAGSATIVTARHDRQLVGLARVITDGATVCFLADVLVHPAVRCQGVGRALALAVLEPDVAVRRTVLLSDDEPGQRMFYESLGFTETRGYRDGPLRTFVRIAAEPLPGPAGTPRSQGA